MEPGTSFRFFVTVPATIFLLDDGEASWLIVLVSFTLKPAMGAVLDLVRMDRADEEGMVDDDVLIGGRDYMRNFRTSKDGNKTGFSQSHLLLEVD